MFSTQTSSQHKQEKPKRETLRSRVTILSKVFLGGMTHRSDFTHAPCPSLVLFWRGQAAHAPSGGFPHLKLCPGEILSKKAEGELLAALAAPGEARGAVVVRSQPAQQPCSPRPCWATLRATKITSFFPPNWTDKSTKMVLDPVKRHRFESVAVVSDHWV